jgi:hypothetical protein
MARLRVDHPDLVQAQMEFDHVKRKRAAELKVVPLDRPRLVGVLPFVGLQLLE